MDANKKYQELFKQALKAYPQVKKQTVQEETTKLWKMVKSGAKTYDEALQELASKAMKTKSKIGTFWGNLKKKIPRASTSSTDDSDLQGTSNASDSTPVVVNVNDDDLMIVADTSDLD